MSGVIPYGRQDVTNADVDAVVEVLRSDFLTQGPVVPAFERAVASIVGVEHAFAMNSATSALHLACLAVGVGPGDLVWTSPITFVASANCARYCGADVDFVDIDERTYNLSLSALEMKLESNRRSGRLPKAVVVVHLCGQSADMRAIAGLAKRYGFKVIEDASHAIGGKFDGQMVGACQFSDVTVFSFHPVKIITTAEGGMALTNKPEIAERFELLRSHGVTRDAARMTHESEGPWYYQQIDLGFNYRMTEIQAALGMSQLNRLGDYVRIRNELADRYDEMLAALPLGLPWRDPRCLSAFHLYVIRLKLEEIQGSRRSVFERMRSSGVGVNVHYIPVHLQPYWKQFGFSRGDFPNAERYYEEAITLPLYPTMSHSQQDFVVESLRKAVQL